MFDLREAHIAGDDALVLALKHHYLSVRVGDLDTASYGKDALTFCVYALTNPTGFILVPNKEVVRVWNHVGKGFAPAEVGSCYQGSPHAILRSPSAPGLCVFFAPVSPEEEAAFTTMQHTDLFGSI